MINHSSHFGLMGLSYPTTQADVTQANIDDSDDDADEDELLQYFAEVANMMHLVVSIQYRQNRYCIHIFVISYSRHPRGLEKYVCSDVWGTKGNV